MDMKESYNRIAEDWHKDHQQDDWWVEGTGEFISFLKPDALVLDLGCGGGTKSRYLIDKGLQVVGTDFSEKMIEISKRENPDGTFLVSDLGEVDKLPYQFDGIFMQAVLLHVPKKEIIDKLKKVISKLKDGGSLYISVKERRQGSTDEEIKIEDDYGYEYKRFFSYFTVDEIESYMQEIGLEVVYSAIKDSFRTNWIQVIGKK